MADVDAETLIPSEFHRQALLQSEELPELVQAERVAEAGDTFAVGDAAFTVTDVSERPVEEAVPEDAREDYDAGESGTVYVYDIERRN
jgi:hypothetical protein